MKTLKENYRVEATKHGYFVVRRNNKRAIRVFNTFKGIGEQNSEFELYWLIIAAANIAHKRGWKTCHIANCGSYSNRVSIENNAGHRIFMGDYETIIEKEHFLNDVYFSPDGFWIKRLSDK